MGRLCESDRLAQRRQFAWRDAEETGLDFAPLLSVKLSAMLWYKVTCSALLT